MINKKAIFKILIVIILLIVIIVATIQIRSTLARYESAASTERDVDVAFWVVDNDFQTKRLLIKDIYPSTNTFDYTFKVTNSKDSKIAETDLNYEIVITATTNLPLSYEIIKNGTPCTKTERLYTDEDGTYYREIKLETDKNGLSMKQGSEEVIHNYIIRVTFPQENNTNLEYADLIENIKIDLSAKQLIGNE